MLKWYMLDISLSMPLRDASGAAGEFQSLRDHLAIAVDLEATAILERAEAEWDDAQEVAQMAGDELDQLRSDVLPRLFRGSLVVLMWATFEDCMNVLHRHASLDQEVKPSFDLKRGEGFVDRCRRVFGHIWGYQLWDDKTVDELRLMSTVRNIFAHRAGRLRKTERDKLVNLLNGESASLQEWDEHLVPSADYLRHALELVERAIGGTSEQVMPGAVAGRIIDD